MVNWPHSPQISDALVLLCSADNKILMWDVRQARSILHSFDQHNGRQQLTFEGRLFNLFCALLYKLTLKSCFDILSLFLIITTTVWITFCPGRVPKYYALYNLLVCEFSWLSTLSNQHSCLSWSHSCLLTMDSLEMTVVPCKLPHLLLQSQWPALPW